jgi:hypothetical protein
LKEEIIVDSQDVVFLKLYDRVQYALTMAIKAKLPVRRAGGIIQFQFRLDRKLLREFRRVYPNKVEFKKELGMLLRMAMAISKFQHKVRVNPDGSQSHWRTGRDVSYCSIFGIAHGSVGVWRHETNPKIVASA